MIGDGVLMIGKRAKAGTKVLVIVEVVWGI